MPLRFYNTATRSVEEFSPIKSGLVTMYNCGPTVYGYVHVGNLRSYVFADILRRTLEYKGNAVRQIINITDVGHLVADSDDGEDKMELAVKREEKGVEELITQYSDAFYADLKSLNILTARKYPRATFYINEQKAMIETLSEKGYSYTTSDGIYFDTSKFPSYPDFARLDVSGMQAGNRVSIGEKKNTTDFALWKFSPSNGTRREQEWDSPRGLPRKGFPGWHIECSAIIKTELGDTIDIHTGGIDHIPIHHTNEIAQSMCANDAPLARFWMHNAFMNIQGEKISKSLGNTYRLIDLHERGIPPLAFRYWLLTAHYRTQINFTWEALAGAQSAYNRLTNFVLEHIDMQGTVSTIYLENFMNAIDEDLNTGAGIALLWDLTKDSKISDADKYRTILEFDKVLGIGLASLSKKDVAFIIPDFVKKLAEEREVARMAKDWALSDRLRDEIKKLGYESKDTQKGQVITPI